MTYDLRTTSRHLRASSSLKPLEFKFVTFVADQVARDRLLARDCTLPFCTSLAVIEIMLPCHCISKLGLLLLMLGCSRFVTAAFLPSDRMIRRCASLVSSVALLQGVSCAALADSRQIAVCSEESSMSIKSWFNIGYPNLWDLFQGFSKNHGLRGPQSTRSRAVPLRFRSTTHREAPEGLLQ